MDADKPRTSLTVNGQEVGVEADHQTSLALALRNDLGLKGVRAGCGIGECGSCTVLVDGEPTRSCTTPVEAVEGCTVLTPEGLGTPDARGEVQQVFLDQQAAQCGFCINGMIMSVVALAAKGGSGDQDVRGALSGHICRCGAHARILRAARRALGESDDLGTDATVTVTTVEPDGTETTKRPPVLKDYPDVESWLALSADGTVEVYTGKVELGQGVRMAMGQIVASQIGLPVEAVRVHAASTMGAPDEQYTSGSKSMDNGGVALAYAAAAFKRLLRERAAEMVGRDPDDVEFRDGMVEFGAGGAMLSLASLVDGGPVMGPIQVEDVPDWTLAPLGTPRKRDDLPAKLTGAPAYVHDMNLPGMVHARAVLPPSYDAVPTDAFDFDAVRDMPGVLEVVRAGRCAVVVAEREEQAVRAAARLEQSIAWDDPGLDVSQQAPDAFRGLSAERFVASKPGSQNWQASPTLAATYRVPYQAHAPVAPSCAVASADDTVTRVWTHSQGVHPLRRELATMFHVDAAMLEVQHVDGPGCYGHNMADDAAAFAVLAARAVAGRPVRFVFSVEQEFAWEPFGTAALADVAAMVAEDGRVAAWSQHMLTDVYGSRPKGFGNALILPRIADEPVAPLRPGPSAAGVGNAEPPYAIADVDTYADYVQGPLRVSSHRSLGSYLNVFAGESFMDELAELAGQDPLAFRLAHLDDPRLRRVLEAAAKGIGWEPHVGPSGRGVGIALARYKNEKAIVAQAVKVAVDTEHGGVRVLRVVTAVDAGTVVDLDGLVNQVEGGTIQGLSRALHERVAYDARGVRSRDWTGYPVLGFDAVPGDVRTIVVSSPGSPPLGLGEAAPPPAAAALGNAIDDAIGVRMRTLPITAEALQERLLELTDAEAERVRL